MPTRDYGETFDRLLSRRIHCCSSGPVSCVPSSRAVGISWPMTATISAADSSGTALRALRTAIGIVLLVGLLLSVVVMVNDRTADAQVNSVEVRIVARRLPDGRTEFGLQQRISGNTWSRRQLPRSRIFPTDATANRWLHSSPIELPVVNDVRITARKLSDGSIEFGLQQLQSDSSWGEYRLPRVRYFPNDAAPNRWLVSSTLDLASPTTISGTFATDSSERDCTFEQTMSRVSPSVFQVVTDRGIGTAFYVGDSEFLTAYHVVEGADTIRLQNSRRSLQGVRIVGIDVAADVAILRASRTDILPMNLGDDETLGPGARVAVLGYPLFETGGTASITSGLLSARWTDREHDNVFYLQTDAAANPGNSGGPMITACGDVVGLVVSKISAEGVEGISFAVSATALKTAVARARANGPHIVVPPPRSREPVLPPDEEPEPPRVTPPTTQKTIHLVLSVEDSAHAPSGSSGIYVLSTQSGCFGNTYPWIERAIALVDGRSDVTSEFGDAAGIQVSALSSSGLPCEVTFSASSQTSLPRGCFAKHDSTSANLATSSDRVVLELEIDCHEPDVIVRSGTGRGTEYLDPLLGRFRITATVSDNAGGYFNVELSADLEPTIEARDVTQGSWSVDVDVGPKYYTWLTFLSVNVHAAPYSRWTIHIERLT